MIKRPRSIVGRVALRAIVAALIAITVLYGATAWVIDASSRHAAMAAIDTDLAGLADINATSGATELAARIRDRLALTPATGDRPHYLLTDAAGRRLAGDLAAWPALSDIESESGTIALDANRDALARATRLAGGTRLVVAREVVAAAAVQRSVAGAFVAAGLIIIVLVGGLAWFGSHRLAARVARINAAFRAGTGAIDGRSVDSDSDEIGELARNSAAALDRVAHLAEAQRHVSDNLAHEIRTPLMHLDQRLVALIKASSDRDTARDLGRARADLRGVVAMLESLLDIAASEARRGDPAGLQQVDLSRLVSDVLELYSSSLEEAGLGLERDIASDVKVAGEPMQLTRLMSNLLDNAIKYVPAGGTISVRLANDASLRVCDDGPGIPAEARAKIFDRFRRGDPALPSGHGLGLALARAIAERHGLSIALEDREVGCCFVIAPA